MHNQRPAADHPYRFRDSTFLLAIAVLAIAGAALSFFYIQTADRTTAVTAADDRPSVPLPAGPRKYQ